MRAAGILGSQIDEKLSRLTGTAPMQLSGVDSDEGESDSQLAQDLDGLYFLPGHLQVLPLVYLVN